MDFWRFQFVNGRLVQAPIEGLLGLGDFGTRDPEVPWLPLGASGSETYSAAAKPEIEVRSTSSVSYSSRTNTTYTAPAGIVDGDIIVIYHGLFGTPPAPTPPSGFTLYDDGAGPLNVVDGGYSGDLYLYWKRASGESGNYTVTHSASNSAGLIVAYKNCLASGTPFGAQSADNSGTNNLGIGNSLVATADRSRLIFMEMDVIGGGGLTPPDGMVERIDTEVYIADQRLAREGETSATRRHTNGGTAWATRMVELLAEEVSSGIVGSASITLDAATLSATGTLPIAGTASITLGAATLSATGAVALTGALSATLGDVTLSAAGTLGSPISGAAAITLADATLSATGAVALAGTASITLDAATLTATGTLPLAGAASITLGDATLSATGKVALSGSLSATLADATLSATGALAIAGALSVTLEDVTLAAEGVGLVLTVGEASITLDDVTLTATGEVQQPANDDTIDVAGSQAVFRAMRRQDKRRKRREEEARARLRATIERVAREIYGEDEPPEPAAVAALAEARDILAAPVDRTAELRAEAATLAEIRAAIIRLEALLREEQEDEEAAEMMLLVA